MCIYIIYNYIYIYIYIYIYLCLSFNPLENLLHEEASWQGNGKRMEKEEGVVKERCVSNWEIQRLTMLTALMVLTLMLTAPIWQ